MSEAVWRFETVEQADAFIDFTVKLKRAYLVVKDSRDPCVVIMNNLSVRANDILIQMAKAYHFGWMASKEARIEDERAACAQIAETIRKRELANYTGANCPYDTIAEEIRDRIQMRPATSNDDWPELGSADDQWAIRNLSRS